MSELTQTLKIFVTRYPGTMAELARKASIDRSTLYKIVSGQRTPREQLEHLADALELTEEQKTTLLLQYKQRGRGTDPRMRAELHHLLEALSGWRISPTARGIISNEAAQPAALQRQYVEGTRAVAAAVALVANHCIRRYPAAAALAVHKPGAGPGADRTLFGSGRADPVALSQLLIYARKATSPGMGAGDIATLTRTLPLFFLPKLNYDARVVRCVMSEPSPGALMPVYLLLPTAAFMMDRLGQKGYIITDREAVENLRLAFSRKYIDACRC